MWLLIHARIKVYKCRERDVGGGENVPIIPDVCATYSFAYLVRGPFITHVRSSTAVTWPCNICADIPYDYGAIQKAEHSVEHVVLVPICGTTILSWSPISNLGHCYSFGDRAVDGTVVCRTTCPIYFNFSNENMHIWGNHNWISFSFLIHQCRCADKVMAWGEISNSPYVLHRQQRLLFNA